MSDRLSRIDFIDLVRHVETSDRAIVEQAIGEVLRNSGFLRDEEAFDAGLQRFQRYYGVPETGEIDDPTKELLVRDRCAVPTAGPAAASTLCGWKKPVLRYMFADGTRDVTGRAEFDVVRRSLRTLSWSGAPHFVEGGADDTGVDVVVAWTPAECGDEDMTGGALAHADFPPGCAYYDNAPPQPIHFDDEEHTWSDGGSRPTIDVESVALHEAGHIVGLLHTNVDGAVMVPTFGAGEQLRRLHPDDLSGIMSLYRGRAHTYAISPRAAVRDRKETKLWTAGWSTAERFETNAGAFLFLLKHGTGDVHVHQLEDGNIGARIVSTRWTPWWTTAQFYRVGTSTFLFLLKERGVGTDGNNVHVHRVNEDGTVGDRIASQKWSEGWTTAEFFRAGAETYLFLLKERGIGSDGNNVHIHRVDADGTIGQRVASHRWTEGWTTAEIFDAGGAPYLFLLKAAGFDDNGDNVHINRVNGDGTIEAERWLSYRWTEGWTAAQFFEMCGAPYLFLLKLAGMGDDGKNVHVHRITDSGKVGQRCSSYKWSEGWSSVQIYPTNGRRRLFVLKSCDPIIA